MQLTMMKAKLHRAVVTQCDPHYEGSITVDADLLDLVGILPHEQVDVLNINTGGRFTTYAIPGPRGARGVGINGAAARLAHPGDRVIIVAYARMDEAEARAHTPGIAVLDEHNRPTPKPVAA